jgi:hypothetical protein
MKFHEEWMKADKRTSRILSGVKVQSFTFTTEAQSSQRKEVLFVPRNPRDKQKAIHPLGYKYGLGRRPEAFWRIGISRFSRELSSSVNSVSQTNPAVAG